MRGPGRAPSRRRRRGGRAGLVREQRRVGPAGGPPSGGGHGLGVRHAGALASGRPVGAGGGNRRVPSVCGRGWSAGGWRHAVPRPRRQRGSAGEAAALRGTMIVCRTLSPVSVEVDGAGAPTELMWRKNIALVVYLARSPKRARTRDHLIGLLWGDKPDDKARHSLNEAVGTLRPYVGEGGLDSDAAQVRLNPGAVQLDVDQLEGFVAAGDHRRAAALIQGDFLEGFGIKGASEFENWLTAERAYWKRRSVDVLVRCCDELLATGALAEATQAARGAWERDAQSDAALRAVMRCLALAGDRAGALKAFQTFAVRLKAEVGTEPDAETRELAERIRHERPLRVPQRVGPGTAEARRAPLVGRAAELERLVAAWATCRKERRATVATVEGDAGMGKTRLAEELVARARLDGAVVAAVRAVEADRSDAWSGVFGLARGGLLDAPGVAAGPPPALAQLRGDAPVETPGRAFSDVLQAVADEQPALVFADDVHWLDRESLLALGAAARDLARAPVLFLLTAAAQPSRAAWPPTRPGSRCSRSSCCTPWHRDSTCARPGAPGRSRCTPSTKRCRGTYRTRSWRRSGSSSGDSRRTRSASSSSPPC